MWLLFYKKNKTSIANYIHLVNIPVVSWLFVALSVILVLLPDELTPTI